MRGWFARIAIGLSVLASITASASTPPRVLNAVTGIDGGSIARLTLRFSDPMVPLGKGGPPIAMTCAIDGAGRWVDPTTFVWEFAKPLPGGIVCRAQLKPGLKTLAGRLLGGARSFTVDSGGPFARAVLPDTDDDQVEEDQTFFVAVNGAVDRASVAAGAYCTVDGIGERIAVDLLPADTVDRVLSALGDRWQRRSFLRDAGVEEWPEAAKDRAAALANIVPLKCRRPLPPGRDMALIWGGNIRSPAGKLAGEDRRFDYKVRKEFTARLTCGRVNAQAGCDPVEAIKVEFSAPVPRAKALAVRIEAGDRQFAPVDEGHAANLDEVSFKPPLPPSVTARLVVPLDLSDESGRPLANARRFPLAFAIAEAPPLVKFAAPFGILEAKEGGVLPVTIRAVEPNLAQGIGGIAGGTARIDADDKVIAEWVRRVAKAQEVDFEDVGDGDKPIWVNHTGDKPLFGPGDRVERTELKLPSGGRAFEVVGIPLQSPGFYVVELASPTLGRALLGRNATRYVSAAALVTDMAVHFKWGRGSSLVWVTSLAQGEPVAGAAIQITDSCDGKQLASGTTDKSGRLLITSDMPEPTTAESCDSNSDSHPLMVSARKSGDFSFALSSWGDGIRPYDFDLPFGWSPAEPILHAILDRTLMRAGETAHMTFVYRAPTPTGLRSGGALEGTLVLQHRGSDTSFEVPLRLGADGIGEAEWTAPKGAAMGDYDIRVKVADDKTIYTRQSIRVDEYRLPTMRASVSGPRTSLVRPHAIPLDLYLGYLSGGGARGAPVKLRTAFEPLYDTPAGWDGWSFGGRAVREGVVPLDEDESEAAAAMPDGTTVPLSLDAHGALRTSLDVPAVEDSTRMRIEMDYQDADGETLTASTSVPIYSSAVRLGIKPDGWMQRAQDMRLKVVALDLDGKQIRGRKIEIALYTREILSARRRLIGGFYAFDNSARTTRIKASCSGVSDAQGLVDCALDPGVSGEVIAVATTVDAGGNEARAVTSVYLAGDDDWWFGGDNGDRMDIVADARSYEPGDVARVQVRMPFREATALVTVEREGVMSSFVTRLSGKDPVVKVPLAGAYAPDVFISVMAVRGRVADWRLWLTEFAQRWHLPFFNQENPTALVDLAKPAYRIGMTQVRVGWKAHALKVAVRADRERYQVRDKAHVTVRVRGPDGRVPPSAEFAFAAVDEALLQLSPNESWDVLAAMMGERPISVLTSTAQMQVVGKRHYGRKALAIGGGGGGDLSSLTRSDFRPVLLWRGRVTLDSKGEAKLDVPLADSLSSYKLVAIATAGGELFGTGETAIRTVQDLSIYSGVPPLVRTGDTFDATFTLRNGTDKAMTVTANAEVQPEIAHGQPQTVTIEPGGAVPVTWRLTTPEGVEMLRWTVSARASGGRAADRLQVDEQVMAAVPEETWAATFLRVGTGTPLQVAAPPGSLPGRGNVEIALAATPAPPLLGVRAYMLVYPYGCFEQRTSKAVALDDRAAWDRLMEELPTYIDSNGLLRYWPGERMPGSIALTAYALSITAEAGLPWPEDARQTLLGAMRKVVDGRLREEGEGPADARFLRLAALAALARNGDSAPAMLGQTAIPLADMPTATLADWLVTVDKTPGAPPRLRAAAEAALRTRIVYEGTRLDLVDRRTAPWWMMVSGDEMAIKALLAVTGRRGWEQESPRMMIGVAMRQRRGHWDTTPSNAWGTLAVRRFAAAYPSAVGGVTVARLGAATVRRPWGENGPIRLPLPASAAPLLLSHDTSPKPWAFVAVRAAVPLTAPAFAGYRVSRQMSFVERQRPGQLSRGDVLKIRLTIDSAVDRTWVVVEDPVPAGASIISRGGAQSGLLAEQANGTDWYPSYVERGLDAWRGYYSWLPKGRWSVEYVVRINATGRFMMPPTRVEAMYSPEIHGVLPNPPLTVAP
ncbi:MAG TPA: MG2 domain-containing protein [Allosphingosinicella sp.]|nr:MG2 domain-containing protein [Allosphingosinicella sp.]